jgi:hypothetical protein
VGVGVREEEVEEVRELEAAETGVRGLALALALVWELE